MSVERARVIKASGGSPANPPSATAAHDGDAAARLRMAMRVPAAVVDAREEATRIVAEARAKADAIVAQASADAGAMARKAALDARETELARLAAEVIAVRSGAERRAERELDHTIQVAMLLAERLVGEGIAVEPARLAMLADGALKETRGARQLRVEACPDDVAALGAILAPLGDGVAVIEANAELSRGSLVVHTELGRVDARLMPQLSRLADALREVLRGSVSPQQGNPHG